MPRLPVGAGHSLATDHRSLTTTAFDRTGRGCYFPASTHPEALGWREGAAVVVRPQRGGIAGVPGRNTEGHARGVPARKHAGL